MIDGWLFDVYPLGDKIILWIKNKKTHRIEKQWTPSLYVASNTRYHLKQLEKNSKIFSLIKKYAWVNKIEKVSDIKESKVLKFTVKNSSDLLKLGRIIESLDKFGIYRLYNIDVPSSQTFMYEHDLFPLGKYKICNKKRKGIESLLLAVSGGNKKNNAKDESQTPLPTDVERRF